MRSGTELSQFLRVFLPFLIQIKKTSHFEKTINGPYECFFALRTQESSFMTSCLFNSMEKNMNSTNNGKTENGRVNSLKM